MRNWLTPWWPQLTQWAKYLEQYGLDPEKTTLHGRFHGPPRAQRQPFGQSDSRSRRLWRSLPDARRQRQRGEIRRAGTRRTPRIGCRSPPMATITGWRLTSPNTWSQKYNLVWDRILGLNVFPPSVAQMEVALLQKSHATLRRAAGFAHPSDQNRLVHLERLAGRQPGRFRSDHFADL